MNTAEKSFDELLRENEILRQRLDESEETIRAISGGEVDAFIIQQDQREQVLMLGSVDRPYRLLIEKMQQGAATVTPEGNIAYANRRFAELVGVSVDKLLGSPIADYVLDAGEPLLDALLAQGQAGGSQGELEFQRRDGFSFPVHMSVSPLLEEAGVFCLILTDLSAQKRHEALVAAETLSRSILDQAVDAIVVCDAAGQVIRASRPAQALSGSNPLLRSFADAFPLEQADGGRFTLEAVFGGATVRGVECRLHSDPKRRVEVLASAGPVLAADESLLGYVVILTDITARKHLEESLRWQAERLAETDRRKDQFLAMLAHELRNPLAPLRNGLQVLNLISSKDSSVREVREMMDRQLDSLIRLVDDLLDVSRITQGKIKLKKERVDLATVVTRGIESSRPFIEERGHQLEVVSPDEPIPVTVDVVRVAQVVLNLLNNAAKFTAPGGKIRLTVEKGAEAVIRVRDTGVGISSAMLSRVFDLFTQADETVGRSEGGLGIGLTLVRYLTEMHGGSVAVFSDGPGCGTEFVVRLPLAAESLAGDSTTPSGHGLPSSAAAARRVLIVDDNRDSANSLAILLKLFGHQVCVAFDGAQALARAAELPPDIVLLDIGLPGMDGYEVARQLRVMPAAARALLVALTGYGTDEDRRQARAAGFDHHLVKPVDLHALEQLLTHVAVAAP